MTSYLFCSPRVLDLLKPLISSSSAATPACARAGSTEEPKMKPVYRYGNHAGTDNKDCVTSLNFCHKMSALEGCHRIHRIVTRLA